MCNYCTWSNKHIPQDPDKFRNCIQNAKYVFTDTFHGTVFSVIYKKEFICFLSPHSDKVRDFLRMTALEYRDFADQSIEYYVNSPIDYEKVYLRIDQLRMNSIAYLDSFLKQ